MAKAGEMLSEVNASFHPANIYLVVIRYYSLIRSLGVSSLVTFQYADTAYTI